MATHVPQNAKGETVSPDGLPFLGPVVMPMGPGMFWPLICWLDDPAHPGHYTFKFVKGDLAIWVTDEFTGRLVFEVSVASMPDVIAEMARQATSPATDPEA